MNKVKDDFFLHSNKVGHISKEDYDKIELLVNAAKAFARSTYQCVYIIDYFHQDFIYASDNLAYLCGLEPEQLMEAGYQMYIDHVPDADLQMLLEVNKKGFDLFNHTAFHVDRMFSKTPGITQVQVEAQFRARPIHRKRDQPYRLHERWRQGALERREYRRFYRDTRHRFYQGE